MWKRDSVQTGKARLQPRGAMDDAMTEERRQMGDTAVPEHPQEHLQLRTCPLCEGMCGVEVRYRGDEVISVRPDRENVHSRGHICPKGTTLGDLHHAPDRLRAPVVKVDCQWREVGWDAGL